MSFKRNLLLLAIAASFGLSSCPVTAAENMNVVIIDSGSDFTHDALNPLARANTQELNGTAGADDDNNGYADDVYGWNFVDNNATLVNLKETPPDYDRVLRCMELLGKLQAYGKEGLTEEEYAYLVKNYQDKAFWAWVGFTGGWAHGTHCAGIVSTKNDKVNLNAIRHIPTGGAPKEEIAQAFGIIKHKMAHSRRSVRTDSSDPQKVSLDDLEKYFVQVGQQYADEIKPKADYVAAFKPRLINCSFGSPNKNIFDMMKKNMAQWGFQNPTDAEIQEVVNLFVAKAFLPRDKVFFSGCKDALVFIAAGNSAEDLDPLVSSPSGVQMENKLIIAATDEDQKIAPFSCYGAKTVDVAVPGVNIYATYPNNKMGYMSGTSMACPNALRMASMVLDTNSDLSPIQLKKILMETVDKKEWLKDKVKSGGVINVNRAIFAAQQLAEGKSIDDAIKTARERVGDKAPRSAKRSRPNLKDPMVKELYFSVIK
ncbi:MAG: S8 family serine peptidase [Candidatus Riflebacteria bacterium]|nr:S8 family serine peptidase [Candidatus Riflebacteria bacterium]